MNRRLPVLAVVGAAVLFGSTGTAQALGPSTTTPLGVGAVRIIVGSLTLWLLAGRTPRRAELDRRLSLIVSGAVGVAAYQPGFFLGTERSGVAMGTIVALGSAPIFAGGLQWRWLGRRPSATWAWATAIMIAGGALVVMGRSGETVVDLVGTVGSLTAGLGYALFALTTKRLIDDGMRSTEALAWQFSFGAVLLAPVLVLEPLAWLGTLSGMAVAAHLGILATGVAYLLYGWGLRTISSSSAVTLTLVEPGTAALTAVLLLGERLEWYGWAGMAIVLWGLVVSGR